MPAPRRHPHHRRNANLLIGIRALTCATLLAAQLPLNTLAATPNTYIGPDQGLWSNPANWSLNLVPNNNSSQTFDVLLNNPSPLTLLDQNILINSLTLTAPATLSVQQSKSLNLAGSTLSNAGNILLNQLSVLEFLTNTTLSGTGAVQLLASTSMITSPNTTVSFSSTNVISGQGSINAPFINTGTISATTGILNLSKPSASTAFSSVNQGLLSADNGTLNMYTTILDNSGGVIEAQSGSSVFIKNSSINGGTIQSLTGATIQLQNTSLQNVTLAGSVAASGSTGLAGTLTNHSALAFTGSSSGTVTFTGGGTITMNGSSSSLGPISASNNIIKGLGTLLGAGLNTGTITATAGTLSAAGFNNSGILRADGGALKLGVFDNVTNTGGLIEAANGSEVFADHFTQSSPNPRGTITGGTLSATNGSTFELTPLNLSGVLLATDASSVIGVSSDSNPNSGVLYNVTSTGHLLVVDPKIGGTMTNTGTIEVFLLRGIDIGGDTVFAGGGTILISSTPSYIAYYGKLTTDNLITGSGVIGRPGIHLGPFTLVNHGTITASMPGGMTILGVVYPDYSVSNDGTFRADGGPLTLNGITYTNTGTIEALNNSKVSINTNITGTGTLHASNGGIITFSTTAHTTAFSSLLLSTDTAGSFTSTLDLASSKLIIQSSTPAEKQSKLPQLTAAISSGAGVLTGVPPWTGKGLTSSTAAADPQHYAVGLFDNSVLNLPTFGNQPTDPNSLLVTIAHLGDANINGIIDIQDQSLITNNWQKPANNWASGDLNLDGFVDIQDLTLVTNNWQQSSNFSLQTSNVSLPTPVPEPTTLALLLAPLLLTTNRRPRAQNSPASETPRKKIPHLTA